MDFAVIINDNIEFCSNKKHYAKFEIAIFADMLIKELGEEGNWKLHKILFHDIEEDKDLKLLTFVERPVIICLLGELKFGSAHGYELLGKIINQIKEKFSIEELGELHGEEKEKFNAICKLIKLTIFGNLYKKKFEESSSHEIFNDESKLIYSGISSSGLPITSKLYDHQNYLTYKDENKKELLTTILSGQLATIAINSYIRAHCFMDSIQIKISNDNGDKEKYLFFKFREFGKENNFIFETLYSGNPKLNDPKINKFKEKIIETNLFEETFSGKLKKYKEIKDYLNSLKL